MKTGTPPPPTRTSIATAEHTRTQRGAHASQASKQAHPAPSAKKTRPTTTNKQLRRNTHTNDAKAGRCTHPHKEKESKQTPRGTARLRLPHPNTQENDPKEWQIQQCGGRVSWCRCRTRKDKKRRKQESGAHPLQVQQQQKSTAQVYTLKPSTTTSPTPNARKHARPLLRTQKTALAERTGKRPEV